MSVRYLYLLVSVCLILATVSDAGAQTSKSVAEVVVTPFIVEAGSDDMPRAISDKCFEQFATALTLKGVAVARDPRLSEKNLQSARAPWAVLGHVTHKEGQFLLELRLLDVKSGEEMRSYMNADKDLQLACRVVEKAAERIAVFLKEQGDHN